MDSISRIAFACVCCLWALSVHAQATCYEYRADSETSWHSSQSAACSSGTPSNEDIPGPGGCVTHRTYSFTNFTANGSEPSHGTCFYDRVTDSGDCGGGTSTVQVEQPYYFRVADCPPDPCADTEGVAVSTVVQEGEQANGTTLCGADSCAYTVSSAGVNVLTADGYKVIQAATGAGYQCNFETEPSDEQAQVGSCIASAGDVTCKQPTKNCGTFNGDLVCVDSLESGCISYASGAVACVADSSGNSSTPPGPDNGTAGTPATPDGKVKDQSSADVINYYSSNTVNNSSSSVVTNSGGPADSDGDGEEDGGSEEEGSGSASGGETCSAQPSCSGDAIQCAILEQEWLSRCPDAVSDGEIESAVGTGPAVANEEFDMSTSFSETLIAGGSGACPAPPTVEFPIFGSVTITVITWFCALAAKLAPFVMAMAYLSAVFIVVGVKGGL